MPIDRSDFLQWFGNRVRLLRMYKNLSQEDLASLSGLDRTYVGGVERGERNLGLINIKKLADALDISVRDMFDDDYQF